MSLTTLGIIGFILLLVLVFLRVNLGFSMAIVGFVGLLIIKGFKMAGMQVGMDSFTSVAAYTFTCIPMFCFMGTLIAETGLGSDLISFANSWLGHIRGGLGVAGVISCSIFAAICGDSQATAITMSKVAYPEMVKHGYDKGTAAAVIAAGGSIGIMIPPSLGFIVYGILTSESIGTLFMAGLLPGICQALLLCCAIAVIGILWPHKVPKGEKSSWSERFKSAGKVIPILILLIIVLGGIYGGLFTTTEAAAIGAFGSIVITLVMGRLTIKRLLDAARDACQICGIILIVMVGAQVFTRFMVACDLPTTMANAIIGLNVNKTLILIFVMIFYLLLGCIFDVFSALLLTVPIIYPVMIALGFDGIWFGVLLVALVEIGEITPPIGMNVFVLTTTTKLHAGEIFRAIVPFIVADFIFVILVAFVPQLTMILR